MNKTIVNLFENMRNLGVSYDMSIRMAVEIWKEDNRLLELPVIPAVAGVVPSLDKNNNLVSDYFDKMNVRLYNVLHDYCVRHKDNHTYKGTIDEMRIKDLKRIPIREFVAIRNAGTGTVYDLADFLNKF